MRIVTEVDVGGLFDRQLTQIEREQLPFAAMMAANDTAFATRQAWAEKMPRVFDHPVPLTLNAVLYTKATKQRLAADIFIRDEAFKGTPPAKYLEAEVTGGTRRFKRMERALQAKGVLPVGMYVVPGKGLKLDAYGNIPKGEVTSILSQLGANPDPLSRASDVSRYKRIRKEIKHQGFTTEMFAVSKQRGGLKPGVYQRVDLGRLGHAVRPVLFFVTAVTYKPRFDIFRMAKAIYEQQFPFHFEREFSKAMETARIRGKA